MTVDAATAEVLTGWLRNLLEERVALGVGASNDGSPVFVDDLFRPWPPAKVLKLFRAESARVGVPKIRLHGLRDTHAMMLDEQHVPVKVISERLGHASVGITLNVDMHLRSGEDQAAADAVGAFLG